MFTFMTVLYSLLPRFNVADLELSGTKNSGDGRLTLSDDLCMPETTRYDELIIPRRIKLKVCAEDLPPAFPDCFYFYTT